MRALAVDRAARERRTKPISFGAAGSRMSTMNVPPRWQVGSFHEFRYAKPLWYADVRDRLRRHVAELALELELADELEALAACRQVTRITAVLLLFDLADHQDR